MPKPATTSPDAPLHPLAHAIIKADTKTILKLLTPTLARAAFQKGVTRQTAKTYMKNFGRYIYAGDTLLHIAAATHQPNIIRALLKKGASPHAKNRLGIQPLHSAAVGNPQSPHWNPTAQAASINALINAGADPNALDKIGVAPLHRAIRTRCAAAVQALLDNGANPRLKNKNGSTPILLATHTTGRGGSGSPEAKQQQKEILRQLQHTANQNSQHQ